ncbi:hypothetical protein CDAR_376981 [Caerostris darwini]|uniref:RING-type domain-containing protein n=1 Tax=Caerostris darwini TaxID=1538125 RepID=A0AAV4PFK7_9ARAC|nr:hypothetical protein CDAR_376981 [Caerostris darwini]
MDPEVIIIEVRSSDTNQSSSSNATSLNNIEEVRQPVRQTNTRSTQSTVEIITISSAPATVKKRRQRKRKAADSKILETASKKKRRRSLLTSCPVCFEEAQELKRRQIPIVQTECGHVFCQICIDHWHSRCFSSRKAFRCPICRRYLYGKQNTLIHL